MIATIADRDAAAIELAHFYRWEHNHPPNHMTINSSSRGLAWMLCYIHTYIHYIDKHWNTQPNEFAPLRCTVCAMYRHAHRQRFTKFKLNAPTRREENEKKHHSNSLRGAQHPKNHSQRTVLHDHEVSSAAIRSVNTIQYKNTRIC